MRDVHAINNAKRVTESTHMVTIYNNYINNEKKNNKIHEIHYTAQYANALHNNTAFSRFLENVSGAGNMLPGQEMFPAQDVGPDC